MKTIEDTLKAVKKIQTEIYKKESQMVELIRDAVEARVQNGKRYLNEEDGAFYFPSFCFYSNPFHGEALESRGVSYPKGSIWSACKIEVECYPAKKDGTRALIGSRFIDITKLKTDTLV